MTGHIDMLMAIGTAMLTVAATVGALMSRKSRRGHGISILIPFRANVNQIQRLRNVIWLKRYWKAQLPSAEIIIGKDSQTDRPFSKSVAVNNAASKAKGDIFVIVDADGFIDADSVIYCANEIRAAEKKGKALWFVPYRMFYRMTEAASTKLLASDPANPCKFGQPLESQHILGDTDPAYGHWYGAMIQICSRKAFYTVGGWDERFVGWGGEDSAAMRAMDTLYGLHKTLPGQVLHIWHPQIGPSGVAEIVHWKERMWEGQAETNVNDHLNEEYYGAWMRPERMRKLVDEGHEYHKHGHHHEHHEHHHKKHHKHHKHHHHQPSV
jgi:glycosyltransferase involved in cell wall biosynthesis